MTAICENPATGTAASRSRFRWHRSAYLVVAIAALALVICNVPGQLESEVDLFAEGQYGPEFRHRSQFAHGWPLRYLQRATHIFASGGSGRPSTYARSTPWQLRTGVKVFRPLYLTIDVMVAGLSLLVAGTLFERWRARRRRIWQLTLRECFALVSCAGVAAGWMAYEKARFDEEQRAIAEMDRLDERPDYRVVIDKNMQLRGPTWLRELLGQAWPAMFDRVRRIEVRGEGLAYLHHFSQLESVSVFDSASGEQLRALESLPRLQALNMKFLNLVNSAPVDPDSELDASVPLPVLPGLRGLGLHETGFRLDNLARLTNLEVLDLSDNSVKDADLAHLSHCTKLVDLCLASTEITDQGLVHLRGLNRLANLNLSSTYVGGPGLKHLRSLSQLECLDLQGTNVRMARYAELLPLGQLPRLKELIVSNSSNFQADFEDLRRILPNCQIVY